MPGDSSELAAPAALLADLELLLVGAVFPDDDKARLGAAPLDESAQEDLGGPFRVVLGQQELRDLIQILIYHSACLQSVTSASGDRQSLTDFYAEVLSGEESGHLGWVRRERISGRGLPSRNGGHGTGKWLKSLEYQRFPMLASPGRKVAL